MAKLHAFSLFAERLKRDGRWVEYSDRIGELMTERKISGPEAQAVARKEFGYLGPAGERAAAGIAKNMDTASHTTAQHQAVLQAMDGLPPTATAQEEFDWVRSHPVMTQQSLDLGEHDITPKDIKSPPHGPAPSRGAVNLLMYLAKNPKELYSPMIKEYQRRISKSSDGESPEGEVLPPDPTIEELMRYAELKE